MERNEKSSKAFNAPVFEPELGAMRRSDSPVMRTCNSPKEMAMMECAAAP